MSRVITSIVLTLLFNSVFAQQEPDYSQYMFNQADYNPGAAGSKDGYYLSALGRQQWMGFPGKPGSSVFSGNAPIKKINSGIGLIFENDKLGYHKDIKVKLAYAYRMDVNEGLGKLGIGISAGFLNSAFKATWRTSDGGSGDGDASIPDANESGTAFDVGLGIFYNTEDLYLGLSVVNLLQSRVKFKTSEFGNSRHFYVTSGYTIALPNKAFEILPSVLFKTDLKTTSADLSALVQYNKKIWGGVSYRMNSAIVGIFGIQLINGLQVGYSYDLSTSGLSKYNDGTHELRLGYWFTLAKEKIPHKNRSVRFL